MKEPKAKGYQLRSDEEEASYLPRIAGWQKLLDEPETCYKVLHAILHRRDVHRRTKAQIAADRAGKARAASAGD
jgi:hypothetical protein